MTKPALTEKEWDSVFTAAISPSSSPTIKGGAGVEHGHEEESLELDSDNGSNSDTESDLESKHEKMKFLKFGMMSLPMSPSPRQTTTNMQFLRFSKKEILECKKISLDFINDCKEVEEMALNYISAEINHPVISCFRELTKGDFTTILQSAKLKRNLNNTEYVVMCLGLLDYMAHAMDNPLYSENLKTLSKSIGVNLIKILAELKIILRRWSVTDFLVKRRDKVIGYLRQLAPKFTSISELNFNETVNNLAPNTSASPIMTSSPKPATVSVSLEPIKTTEIEEPDENRHVLAELKINPNIFDQSESDFELIPKGNPKSHIVCNKNPSPPAKFTTQPVTSKLAKEMFKNRPPPPTALTRVLVPPPDIVDLDDGECEIPASKKPRLDLERDSANTVVNGNIGATRKPVVNAFALLMNRSKEIAQANKLRRAGVPI